tara:strand:- start:547 stop:1281 length:735 start_codon:yes stop_codon:yes gene_type:complete
MSRYLPVNEIINRAAVEVGLLPSSDAVSDTDETYIQMVGLLNSSGQELCDLNDWPVLVRSYEINTLDTDSGAYDLPEDFNYMIDQTGWDRTNQVPIGGPLSAQEWTYLAGRNLVSQTIYASFRQMDGKLDLYPQPPPNGMRLTFEYISRNWLKEQGSLVPNRDTIGAGSNICILDPLLSIKFLKLKFLQAKGFDASAAGMEFDTLLASRIGKDTGAPILSASRGSRAFPYINAYGNVGNSGFGV